MRGNNLKLAKEWLKIGDNELGYAEAALKDFDKFYSQMCVQCHQAIEKYLKGFLVFCGKRYSKIHDLSKLLEECGKIDKDMLQFTDDCKKITDYYLFLRYPVNIPERNKSQAEEAIKIARNIRDLIRRKIRLSK